MSHIPYYTFPQTRFYRRLQKYREVIARHILARSGADLKPIYVKEAQSCASPRKCTMAATRQGSPDIVIDSRIETEALKDCFKHVFKEPDSSNHEGYTLREERWRRDRFLGQGAYGIVYLETCESTEGITKYRAIKEIKKAVGSDYEVDYIRELEAICTFSHPRVSRVICT